MSMPPPDQVFYIASSAWSTLSTPYVLGIQGDDPDQGTPVILWLEQTGAQSQLWTMDGDGHILSQMNGSALTWDSSQDHLVIAKVGDSGYPLQLWNTVIDGFLRSESVAGQVLTLVSVQGQPTAVLSPPLDRFPAPAQSWALQAPTPSPGDVTPSARTRSSRSSAWRCAVMASRASRSAVRRARSALSACSRAARSSVSALAALPSAVAMRCRAPCSICSVPRWDRSARSCRVSASGR
jgi:hypothetical protein